ncbi:type II toxin-antitoxin system RelE/ParE family toxin [Terriglobus saanensis]|uniref:type II toxin-antitoxin system RelE/ParE family toxin n=1 Tax=Terriglobus saanensis TaxID=870903 RepID=UPI0001E50714|nr:type II toxin-antitoxin system RelE/ParE family toxin [Terriglobus saanensis]
MARAAFAFDPQRRAIVLVAADKSGVNEKQFYKRLIDKAEERYEQHLERLKVEEKTAVKKAATKSKPKKGKKR